MKKVIIACTYTIYCSSEVEVPDEFEFDSYDPDERIDELESILEECIDSIIPEPELVKHESIDDIEFEMWTDVECR